jgi:hypothetical protein
MYLGEIITDSMKIQLLTLVILVLLLACKEDDPKPTAAEKQAVLLAGNKDKSKTWILTKFEIEGQDLFEGLCEYDNEYTFFNNASQTFEGKEGVEECSFWDDVNGDEIVDEDEVFSYGPDIEEGVWAFTIDGKTILISSNNTQSDFAIFSLFGSNGLPIPAQIISLTETVLSLEMEAVIGSSSVTAKIEFEAVVPNS